MHVEGHGHSNIMNHQSFYPQEPCIRGAFGTFLDYIATLHLWENSVAWRKLTKMDLREASSSLTAFVSTHSHLVSTKMNLREVSRSLSAFVSIHSLLISTKMDLREVSSFFTAFVSTHSLLIGVGLFLCYLLGNRYSKGISHIPGPTIASCTGFWRLWNVRQGSAHITQMELHQRYGSLVRIGPNHVCVRDPKAIPIIFGSKGRFTKVRNMDPYASGQANL